MICSGAVAVRPGFASPSFTLKLILKLPTLIYTTMKTLFLRFAAPLTLAFALSAIPAEAASHHHTTTVVVKPSHHHHKRVYYSRSTVKDVQRELSKRRFYRGRIDGEFGGRTSSAIRSYQIARRLPVTGQIDPVLLRSLRIRY